MADNILKAIIDVTAPGIEQTTAKVAKSTDAVATSLEKIAAPAAAATTAISKVRASVSQISPAKVEQSADAIANAFSKIANIDFSDRLAQVQERVKASIDAAVPSVIKESEAVEKLAEEATQAVRQLSRLEKQVATFGGGALKFNTNFVGVNALKKLPQVADQATLSMINLGRVIQDAPFGFLGIANNLNPLIEGFSRTAKSAGGFTGAMKAMGKSLVGAGGLSLAVSLVSTGLILFGDKLFGTSKAAKEADEATQKLAQNLSQQAVKLTSLVGLVQNVNVKYEEKQKALRAINQEYKTYLDDLGIEEVSANNVADAYERIIDSLIRQAVVKGLQEEITKAVEETAKKIIEIEKAEQKRRQASQATAQANKFELTTEQAVEQQLKNMNPVIKDGALALQDRNAEVRTGIQVENTYSAVLKRTKDELFSQLAPLLQLTDNFEDLDIKLDKVKKTAAKEVKIPELVLQSSFSEPENLPTLSELTSEVLKLYNRAGSVLGKEFVEGFNNATTSAGAESDAAVFMVQGLEKQFAKEFEKFGLNFFSTAKIDLSKSFFVNSENLTKQLEDIARAFQSAQLTADIASTSFDAAFDALLNGQNALQAIGNALKQLVADLIKATVQALIFKAVTNLLIPGSAAGGAAAGAAGIGRLFGGGVAGLSGNSGFSGGITVAVQGELVGRGGSLVGVVTRAGASNGRSFVG